MGEKRRLLLYSGGFVARAELLMVLRAALQAFAAHNFTERNNSNIMETSGGSH